MVSTSKHSTLRTEKERHSYLLFLLFSFLSDVSSTLVFSLYPNFLQHSFSASLLVTINFLSLYEHLYS